ncbi:hypothetical protein WOLCODRAFT_136094 [Wolfiporia cocos MD-104 SS10]|uniref:Uncharacterized protein n=1 Tax=Wolfiporia cocos (strain MD-104) TaxID=742152 RepID=A0A2H3JQA5_WOLCO|nr:hypothetical protein WOLCODRAFT_136094 [Wolfiporia cocos MD-104 SS10]
MSVELIPVPPPHAQYIYFSEDGDAILAEDMNLSPDEILEFLETVKIVAWRHLDLGKTWSLQDEQRKTNHRMEVATRWPQLDRYVDGWPVDIYTQKWLKGNIAERRAKDRSTSQPASQAGTNAGRIPATPKSFVRASITLRSSRSPSSRRYIGERSRRTVSPMSSISSRALSTHADDLRGQEASSDDQIFHLPSPIERSPEATPRTRRISKTRRCNTTTQSGARRQRMSPASTPQPLHDDNEDVDPVRSFLRSLRLPLAHLYPQLTKIGIVDLATLGTVAGFLDRPVWLNAHLNINALEFKILSEGFDALEQNTTDRHSD